MKIIFTAGVNGRAPLHCMGFKFGCGHSGSFCGGVSVSKVVKMIRGPDGPKSPCCISRAGSVTLRTASTRQCI